MPPPDRPTPRQERVSFWLFRNLAPRLPRIEQPEPPAGLAPFETVEIERPGRPGTLRGTWFPANGGAAAEAAEGPPGAAAGTPTGARGAVLLLPPWIVWGRAYFHRRGRLEALRQAGYHVLTVDFPGFGGSGPTDGFFDRDVADALRFLAARAPGLPRHLWGISSGGYWAHMALSSLEPGPNGVRAAVFEDVSPHLLEWAGRAMPIAKPCHLLFRTLFPKSFRFFDVRRHAAHLQVARAAYVSGERDPGVRPEETRELARLAGAQVRIVPGAGHLEAIKLATDEVVALALETFTPPTPTRRA
jgi:pimeloyl-ACP methyl ester carboxylesterase